MISSNNIYRFTCGGCHRLAKVLHDHTGWPMYAFWRDDDYDIHAFVQTPKGMYLDIKGEHTLAEMANEWGCNVIQELYDADELSLNGWGYEDDETDDDIARKLIPEVLAMAGEVMK